MKIISSILLLLAATFVADARSIASRSYDQLDKSSDVIVIARPVATIETSERAILPHISPDIPVVGLASEFEINVVLKGDPNLKKLVLHHYRLANTNAVELMMNAPMPASFDTTKPSLYLMFLQREPDGRYAPFDQVDPICNSILQLKDAGWENMTPEKFKDWMDAKRWLREGPVFAQEISPDISSKGRADGSLHEAAMNGKLAKAQALIKAQPDFVFSHDSYGNLTPLDFAVQYGHKDVAELLLANHAEVEAKAYGNWSPLLYAVFGGHKDMVELMLAHKANVNYPESAGRTPLHVAAEGSHTEIAALLLANGAKVDAKTRDGYTPLHVAAVDGCKDLINLLVTNKAEYNLQDAAAIGDLERIKTLLKENPDLVSSRDFCNSTALNWAINENQTEVFKFLLANKADVNAGNAKMTPLQTAVVNGRKEIVELLLAKGAGANVKYQNETLAQLAESYGHKDIAAVLRQSGGQ